MFSIHSGLATPLLGDTLFGHIVWGIALKEGEAAVRDFLSSFDNGKPAVIFSNGFPHGFLPFPLMKPVSRELSIEEYSTLKQIQKRKYIKMEYFQEKDFVFSRKNIALAGEKDNLPDEIQEIERMHNTINRITGTTVENGGLFSANEKWIKKDNIPLFDVYALTDLPPKRLKELIENGLENGYGADSSTGKGYLSVHDNIDPVTFPAKGNRFMALSHFVPAEKDRITDLRADLFTKYGKLGGIFVYTKNPFKKPIVMFREGATFSSDTDCKCIGQLLSNVHNDPEIRQHAYAPVIPYNEEENV
jgi:CRISPR-associated protein Csm4